MDPSRMLHDLLFSLRLSHHKAGEGFSSTSITQAELFIGLLRSLRENCVFWHKMLWQNRFGDEEKLYLGRNLCFM